MTIDKRDWQKYPWSFTVQNTADRGVAIDKGALCTCVRIPSPSEVAADRCLICNKPLRFDQYAGQLADDQLIREHEASSEFRLEHGPTCSVGCHDGCEAEAAGVPEQCMSTKRRLWLAVTR